MSLCTCGETGVCVCVCVCVEAGVCLNGEMCVYVCVKKEMGIWRERRGVWRREEGVGVCWGICMES